MKTHTNVQILKDAWGHPAFAVIPFAEYQALKLGKKKAEPTVPSQVVGLALKDEMSSSKAWRTYLELTQKEVAERMGITQGAYAQLEAKKIIRKATREKVAKALGI